MRTGANISMRRYRRVIALIALITIITVASIQLEADTGACGGQMITLPFNDVMGNLFFCQIAEAYFSGLTNGTTPTTFSPSANVPREQMAALITRTMDQSLKRGSNRTALKQFWTPTSADGLGFTTVGAFPQMVESDGADLWVANINSFTVSRVRASDGKLLDTWTGANSAFGVLPAKGLIFVSGRTNPGSLYQIDPTQAAGAVTLLTSALGPNPQGISFDGARVWTANDDGSVSIVSLNPVSVSTVSAGFTTPVGILFDGVNMWVTDAGFPEKLFKLDSNGAIIQAVTVGSTPEFPVFDGTNIWVPNFNSNNVTVVRASTGAVLATLSGNGLNEPFTAAFDGERILITNLLGDRVSLWKAADLTPLGSVSTAPGQQPFGACSDGHHFWITMQVLSAGKLARF
jgi:hypothetical protein